MAGATLTALVPAQVVDLVRSEIAAPRSLRAVVVGGGAITAELYERARALGWPLLPSYGLTECGSQVATARADSPELHLLDHVEARVEADGRLALRSQSLLTGYASEGGFVDPKAGGWFVTEDVASLQGRVLRVEGRRGDFVKVGGESVDLSRLDRILGREAFAGCRRSRGLRLARSYGRASDEVREQDWRAGRDQELRARKCRPETAVK